MVVLVLSILCSITNIWDRPSGFRSSNVAKWAVTRVKIYRIAELGDHILVARPRLSAFPCIRVICATCVKNEV